MVEGEAHDVAGEVADAGAERAESGDVCAVTGLSETFCGQGLGSAPSSRARLSL